jgi:hypothetical protein
VFYELPIFLSFTGNVLIILVDGSIGMTLCALIGGHLLTRFQSSLLLVSNFLPLFVLIHLIIITPLMD